jgi:endonuclease-3 related protein
MAAGGLIPSIDGLHARLLEEYGPQGWWPIPGMAGRRGFDARGYHHGSFDHPRTREARFEVILGAVLTQNTAWANAEMALARLRTAGVRLPIDLLSLPERRLAGLIRSSGYYRQKARALRGVATLFSGLGALGKRGAPCRERLLGEWGIGPETADSILLYAFQVPVFVVDAYTRRLLSRIGVIGGREPYSHVQGIFHEALPREHRRYNELHALIVEHARRRCRVAPLCGGCPIRWCGHHSLPRAKPPGLTRERPAARAGAFPAPPRGAPSSSH